MFRQGDILIVPQPEQSVPAHLLTRESDPRDARGRLVLALGEATGHAHAVPGPGRLLTDPSGTWLHLPPGGRLVHEEHDPITLPAGWFRVVRQREYIPGAYRYVAD
ncbi:hypothetical protein [Nonomuraea longicatena]|uniref:Uncharacterized protein n=1 Tax=Nonomuraea longicatena TaxID=83682 RepID=A0ABN1QF70_9ACTN